MRINGLDKGGCLGHLTFIVRLSIIFLYSLAYNKKGKVYASEADIFSYYFYYFAYTVRLGINLLMIKSVVGKVITPQSHFFPFSF